MKLLKKLAFAIFAPSPPSPQYEAYSELSPPSDNRVFGYVRKRGFAEPVIPVVLFDARLGNNWEFVGEPYVMRPYHYHLSNRELAEIYPLQGD